MLFRSDGLLRGSREERVQAVLGLADTEWDLGTLLDAHCALLDHAEDVRVAAMEALQAIAKRRPEPVAVTPVRLLSAFLFRFTIASGMRVDTFRFLVQLKTPEADEAVERALIDAQRNEDFRDFICVLQDARRMDLAGRLKPVRLPKTKAAILRSALNSVS